MNELYLGIAEDMRRERAEKLWRSFGRLAVTVSVGIIIATIAYVLWQNHTQSKAAEKTSQLLQGQSRVAVEDYKTALPIFSSLMTEEQSNYYLFAALRKAQAQSLSGDTAGAAATYAEIAKRNAALTDVAQLTVGPEDRVITASPASPFYHSLREYNAWLLLEQGKKDEAVQIFASLAQDEKAPITLARRAQQVLQHIAPDVVSKLEAAPNE